MTSPIRARVPECPSLEEAIEQRRLNLGMTRRDAAAAMKVSEQNLAHWIVHKHVPNRLFLATISSFLETTTEAVTEMRLEMRRRYRRTRGLAVASGPRRVPHV